MFTIKVFFYLHKYLSYCTFETLSKWKKYCEFKSTQDINKNYISRIFSDSNFGIRKATFNKLNGFENWKSSADVEFHYRVSNNKITSKNIEKALFYKRSHKDALSLKVDTNGTLLKQNYIKVINQKLRNKKWVLNNKKTASFIKITDYNFIHYKNDLKNKITNEKGELYFFDSLEMGKNTEYCFGSGVNGKKIFTLSEYNNRTGAVNQLNVNIYKQNITKHVKY